uniref:MLO-like protein 1 n=1 Tax=Aegilops tauschii TaxID=37682 RepID=R7W1K6_AEGTA
MTPYWIRPCMIFYTRIMQKHCNPTFNFYNYMIRALEVDFKKVVGISWYLWALLMIFLLLNVQGLYVYIWISLVPFIVTYGFKSCIMGNRAYAISRVVISVISQLVCCYITLPLYAIVSH